MVWRRAAMFDRRRASASTWLFTIARNKRIDALRRERRPEIDPTDPALVPDSAPSAEARRRSNIAARRQTMTMVSWVSSSAWPVSHPRRFK